MAQENRETERDAKTTRSSELGDIVAFVGHGVEFEGVLTYRGNVRIDGQFEGEIETADTLFIGEDARVNAQIRAGSVVASGNITGNITARQRVEFKSPAVIDASLFTPKLSIDNGVVFNGKIAMTVPGMTTSKGNELVQVPDTIAMSEVTEGESQAKLSSDNDPDSVEDMPTITTKPFTEN